MAFYIAAFFLGMPENLPLRSVESITQGNVSIFMGIAVNDNFIAWNVQIDAYVECVALVFVVMWLLNRYVATCEIRMHLSQCIRFFADVALQRCRTGHSVE